MTNSRYRRKPSLTTATGGVMKAGRFLLEEVEIQGCVVVAVGKEYADTVSCGGVVIPGLGVRVKHWF